MRHYIFFLTCFISQIAWSQDTDTAIVMPDMVISASRFAQKKDLIPQQIQSISRRQIEATQAQSTADLLSSQGIFVQKSQQGGGSPVLRGFEASRVLITVDGVRMNNAIYRAGHLQNVITLDNSALERVEVLYGPASTMYGTDALGGALCFYTKSPSFAHDHTRRTTGSAFVRYGTVNQEKTGHAEFSIANHKLGAFTALTYSDFGDLKMGKNIGLSPSFGKRNFYVETINGEDKLVRNDDPYLQRFSAYKQYDLLEKIQFRPTIYTTHTLNVQFSNSSDIPRYDRLTDPGPKGLNSAEWYYGPQKRLFGAYTYELREHSWFDRMRATASWQNIEESRHQRKFNKAALQNRTETIGVGGLNVDAIKYFGARTLQLGLDGQYNKVNSEATAVTLATGASEALDTRYPDGGSSVTNLALYGVFSQRNVDSIWNWQVGFRAGINHLKATFTDQSFFHFPFNEAIQKTPVFSVNTGLVRRKNGWRMAVNLATGFRAPNVDDLVKVFESSAGQLIVPNADLKPEKTVGLDFSVGKTTDIGIRWEITAFQTWIRDALVVAPFTFNGQDSIVYDGVTSAVAAMQNQEKGRINGISGNLEIPLQEGLYFNANLSKTVGRVTPSDGPSTPLDHIAPLAGRLGFRYERTRLHAELFSLFNGPKPIEDYRLNAEDNEAYAPASGMPAWFTLNCRASWKFPKGITATIGIDNMLDVQYRVFASGINGPGRNIFGVVKYAF